MAPLNKKQLNPDSDPCAYACDIDRNPERFCPLYCIPHCPDFCDFFPEPPPSPRPPPPPPVIHHNHHHYLLSPTFISMFALLASAFVIAVSYLIYSLLASRHQSPARRQLSSRVLEYDSSTDVLNFHPAWYIATVGLQRSTVESIPVRVYKPGDSLVHGTGCAVCLAEFREDDVLRLLPKCRHAFHVGCIDTWLSSRTTCPVCRAAVVVVVPASSNEASVIEVVDGPSTSSSGEAGSENSDDAVEEEVDERRLMRRAMSMSSLCVESIENSSSGCNSLVGRSYSCTGKVFSSSRNGLR